MKKEDTMRKTRTILLSATILGAAILGGCAPTQLGANYGTAYYTMKESQILNPDAAMQQEPVAGLEGHATMTAIGAYRKTFEKPDADFGKSTVTSGVQTR
jgi:hypothetical protein